MHIGFCDDGTMSIGMKDYVTKALNEFGESISKSATLPAKRDLLEINEKSERLSIDVSETFHSVVAKLLYVSKWGSLDIQLVIAFLCTQVSCSTNKQGWTKLRRVLEYLHRTLNEYLVLGRSG
jgi:hypothetical protein